MAENVPTGIRLTFRNLNEGDVPALVEFCNDRAIYENTLMIPLPYTEDRGREFVKNSVGGGVDDEHHFAICLDGKLIGVIGYEINKHDVATVGYWIGKPYRGNGYCTEALRALVAFLFQLKEPFVNCIRASHMSHNPASGRVMERVGMRAEGTMRARYKKDGKYIDSVVYSLLRSEYDGGAV